MEDLNKIIIKAEKEHSFYKGILVGILLTAASCAIAYFLSVKFG